MKQITIEDLDKLYSEVTALVKENKALEYIKSYFKNDDNKNAAMLVSTMVLCKFKDDYELIKRIGIDKVEQKELNKMFECVYMVLGRDASEFETGGSKLNIFELEDDVTEDSTERKA